MRTEQTTPRSNPERSGIGANADRGVATLGTMASIAALFSAAACCVLPLGFAAFGVGSAGLSSIVPFHWPLTIAAIVAVATGWFFYLRKRRAYLDRGRAGVGNDTWSQPVRRNDPRSDGPWS